MQRFLCASVALAMLASPASALTIQAGIDLFMTIPGHTVVDFSDNPIPAGAFCSNSPAFTGQIALKGQPLVASPSLGTTDTIVERLHDVDVFPGGPAANVAIQIRALSMVGEELFRACGTEWSVQVSADPAAQRISSMSIEATSKSGGVFDSQLDVSGTITFTSTRGTVVINDDLQLKGFGSSWMADVPATRAANAAPIKVDRVAVDTNADGKLDLALRGTSNFHAGWNGALQVPVSENDRLTAHFVLPPFYPSF